MSAPQATRDAQPAPFEADEDEARVGLPDLLAWLGEGKRLIATVTLVSALAAAAVAFVLTPIFTARVTLKAPESQQQSGAAGALAALGSLGGLVGGIATKTPDELYVALLKSDSVQRSLAQRFDLKQRWDVQFDEQLRTEFANHVRIAADKKSGLIAVDVDDKEPKFAADLANAYAPEITKVLGRLALSEAQTRRVYFEQQLGKTKEQLIKAEQDLRRVQEASGVIVLDKQAEAMITGAALVRAQIAEREVMLKVLRGTATEQNPEVQRLAAEVRAMRTELARMESGPGGDRNGDSGSASSLDMPIGKLPAAGIDYVRARRELKLQEALLEAMLRQYEIARLDEAKEGPALQQVDIAIPPDHKSKPARMLIVLSVLLLAALLSSIWVVWRRYAAWARELDPQSAAAWTRVGKAWRW